ncbi:MAG: histidine-type phosphatase [Alistipes sp.]|nr:histidine-type phosphatase [Candidatus Alistipes equi]
MKTLTKVAILILFTLAHFCVLAQSQALKNVRENIDLARGHEGPYNFYNTKLSAEPKGYKAFYISHYNRHGARYAWAKETYILIRDVLEKAKKEGALTLEGQKLYDAYMDFYEIPLDDFGALVPLGAEQLYKIGEQMYRDFPEVLGGDAVVSAASSPYNRVIMSMASFCNALIKSNPNIKLTQRAYHSEQVITRATPVEALPLVFYERGKKSQKMEDYHSFLSRTVDVDAILSRLIKSSSVYKDKLEKEEFLFALYDVWSGYRSYTEKRFLDGVFSEDERVKVWEAVNYRDYKFTNERFRNDVAPTVVDIVKRADDAIEGRSNHNADLRFGHDFVIYSLLMFLDINNFGVMPSVPEDLKDMMQNYKIPMASNLQFIFYRNAQQDVLFKLIYNGSEATIGGVKPVTGSYYRWSEFRDVALKLASQPK